MPELWQPIKGYEGLYEVSDQGRVRRGGVCLKPRKNLKGYLRVNLSKNNQQETRLVHALVAQAFLDRPLGIDMVLHTNDIKTDNRLANLRWGTHMDNMGDAVKNRKMARGVKHGSGKLTESQVLLIRKDTRCQQLVAEDYGVDRSTISNIKQGNTWAWLTEG